MNFLNIYTNLIRAFLLIASAYHLFRHEYKLIVSTGMAFLFTFIPVLLNTVFDTQLNVPGEILYMAVIVMSTYFGSGLKFYDKYSWWDRIIHFMSGIVFVSFGIGLSKHVSGLSDFHVLFFSSTLSLSLHLIWEVMEYLADCVLHTDNQRWQKHNATINHQPKSAIQPPGLVDTMSDTLVCIAGTMAACLAWWVAL